MAPRVKIFMIAGEKSGDYLGAKLMRALRALTPDVQIIGVGGEAMVREGLSSLFPMSDIAVNGLGSVLARAPLLMRRIQQAAAACAAYAPDALVLIDAPDFTHRVARRVRAQAPAIKIVNYVSPTVWAWRPGRAKAMRGYIDVVLALFPFEPEAYRRLAGPRCAFVGHPLLEHLDELRPNATEAMARAGEPPLVLLMPGSRASEIARLTPIFGEALHRATFAGQKLDVVLPAVPHLEKAIRAQIQSWPHKPEIIVGDRAKLGAFRRARAALVASGTVTLELGLSGVPMVVGYRVGRLEEMLKFLVDVPSIVLTNLILGENVVPEFVHGACNADNLAGALKSLIEPGPARQAQLDGFARLPGLLFPPSVAPPSVAAASEVLKILRKA